MANETETGAVTGGLRTLLRLEGLALFAAALGAYAWQGGPWWLFVVLFLAPDLAFLGYLAGQRAGAIAYNALHTTIGPIALAIAAVVADNQVAFWIAAIWGAPCRLGPGAGLWPQICGRLRLHPPRPHRPRGAVGSGELTPAPTSGARVPEAVLSRPNARRPRPVTGDIRVNRVTAPISIRAYQPSIEYPSKRCQQRRAPHRAAIRGTQWPPSRATMSETSSTARTARTRFSALAATTTSSACSAMIC